MGISSPLLSSPLLNLSGTSPATASFLLDVLGVSAVRAYSMRRLATAYAGSAIRVRRSSDNSEQDIGFVGEALDTTSLASFVGAGSGFISRWYDQSGNADDLLQTTTGLQPRIVNSGTIDTRNSLSCAKFDGTDDRMAGVSSLTTKECGLILATTEAGPNWSNYKGSITGAPDTGGDAIGIIGDSGNAGFYTGAGAFKSSIKVDNGSNAPVFGNVLQQVNGHDATGGSWSTPNLGDDRNLGDGGRFWPGWIGEVVLFTSELSAGNRTALYTNQKTYWGTP